MTTSHGRRIQSRRALAIMAWVSLVVIAALLWYGQEKDIIRIQAWEPAALLLSAYSAFLAIFGWLLFAPERKSAEESPALFFSGMLTLIPPCFIAYHLMPPSSPLRGWLTLGVFVFGLIAILSPLPKEVFAVPRDRKSYLKPLTDCYLSVLNVDEPKLELQSLVPRSYYALRERDPGEQQSRSISSVAGARDPWTDPFYGTGRQLSEVGSARRATYSESRSRGGESRSDFAEVIEPAHRATDDQDDAVTFRAPSAPSPRPLLPPAPPLPQTTLPSSPSTPSTTRPPMTARSAFAPRESRTPNYRPPAADGPTAIDPTATSATTAVPRRPLTDPGEQSRPAVGFQSPPASRPVTSSPPPVPSYFVPVQVPVPPQPQTLPQSPMRSPLPGPRSEPIRAESHRAVPEFRPASAPATSNPPPPRDSSSQVAASPSARMSEMTLQELDRQMKELEAEGGRTDESVTDLRFGAPQTLRDDANLLPAAGTSTRLNDVQMERIRDEYGGEMIDGTIKVFFDVGQKRAHLHVPFSPPLPGVPEVECEPVSDDSVRLKVGVRQPYGIRLEARRSDAARALNTEISFAAVYTPVGRRT